MAGRKRAKARGSARRYKRKGGRRLLWTALVLLCALIVFIVYGYVCAHIVRVEYRDVYIEGLKPGQDGLKVLFVSDFKIRDMGDAKDAAALMRRLYELNPDLVILGGDYTGYTLGDRLTMDAQGKRAQANENLRRARQAFFASLKPLNTTGRLFVIEGDADVQVAGLNEDVSLANGILLADGIGYVSVGGDTLTIVGAKDYGGARSFRFKNVTRAETVIAVTHNPNAYAQLATVTDASGRAVADLILAGHTLGGQVRLFGHTLMPGGYTGEFVSGHYKSIGVNMLVSRGVGADYLSLRVGAGPEAYLITLRAG